MSLSGPGCVNSVSGSQFGTIVTLVLSMPRVLICCTIVVSGPRASLNWRVYVAASA